MGEEEKLTSKMVRGLWDSGGKIVDLSLGKPWGKS